MASNEYDRMLESANAPQGPDPYASAMDAAKQDQKAAVQQSMYTAAQVEPDQHAKVVDMALKAKLSTDVVQRNFDQVAKQIKTTSTDYDALIENSPGTSSFLQNPDHASVAQDDIPALQKTEQVVQDHSAMHDLRFSLAHGFAKMFEGAAYTPALAYNTYYLPANVLRKTRGEQQIQAPNELLNNPMAVKYHKEAEAYAAQVPDLNESITAEIGKGNYSHAGRVLAVQFASSAPQLAAMLATALAGAPGLGVAEMGVTAAAEKTKENQDQKVEPVTATGNALATGAIQSVLAHAITFNILGKVEGQIVKKYGQEVSKEVFKDFAKTMVQAVGGQAKDQALTSAAQDMTDYMSGVNVSPGTSGERFQASIQRAVDQGIVGGFTGGIMTGPSALASGHFQAAQARQDRATYLAMGESAEALKIRQRLPEAQRAFVDSITKNGPVENLFISPAAVDTYFQEAKLNPVAQMQQLGVLPAYSEAKARGGDVKIPLSTWVKNVVGTEHYQALANDVKFSVDGLSVNEAKALQDEHQATFKETQKALQEQLTAQPTPEDKATQSSVSEIKTQVKDQLQQLSEQYKAEGKVMQIDDKQISAFSEVVSKRYEARAAILGVTPGELFARERVPFQMLTKQITEGQVLNQQSASDNTGTVNLEGTRMAGAAELSPYIGQPTAKMTHGEAEQHFIESSAAVNRAIMAAKSLPETAKNKAKLAELHAQRETLLKNEIARTSPGGEFYQAGIGPNWSSKGKNQETLKLRDGTSVIAQPVPGQSSLGYRVEITNPKGEIQSYDGFESIDKAKKYAEDLLGVRYDQEGPGGPRGRITITPTQRIIELGPKADVSTLLHESGHGWLDEVGRDLTHLKSLDEASLTEQQKNFLNDGQEILKWLGVDSFEKIGTKEHEQFARGIESYFMSGKAPTTALGRAFAQFKVWLINIYKNLGNLNVKLSPEIHGVMDRLIATQDEIDATYHQQNVSPLFGSNPEGFGLTGAKLDNYLRATAEARSASESILLGKFMKDFQREREQFYRDERKTVKSRIEDEVNKRTIYKALAILQTGALPDGSRLPEGVEPIKLSKKSITEVYGEELIRRLPKGIYDKTNGFDFNSAAELLGFENGEAMLTQMANAPKKTELVDQLTDNHMQEVYPDLLKDPQAIKDEAMKAFHNVPRSKLLRLELEYLAANEMPVLKEVIRRTVRRVPTEEMVREQAVSMIAAKTLDEVKPYLFLRAERQAAKEAGIALAKGDLDGAFEAKKRELLNNELYQAAADANTETDKALEFFKKYKQADDKIAKTREMDFVNAGRAILAQFGIGPKTKQAQDYIQQIKQYDPEMYETVYNIVTAATEARGDYKQVSFNDFKEMADTVQALWDLAKSSRQIEIDGLRMDRQEVQGHLQARLSEMSKPGPKMGYDKQATTWDKVKMGFLGLKAAMTRVESWVDVMDGGDPKGFFRNYMWTPVSEAIDRYRLEQHKLLKKYLEENLKPIKESLTPNKINAPEIGYEFANKAELLAAMLHTGNESNLRKLLVGRGWGSIAEDGSTNTSNWESFTKRMHDEGVLTKADYEYLQKTWDMLESIKPLAQKAHKQMYGYHFAEITAKELETPYGKYRGGYMPAIVDSFLVPDAAIRAEKESLEKNNNSWMFPTTGRGFTKGRVEYNAALLLQLSAVPMHIDKVLRFAHIEPRVKEVSRIIMDRNFRKALNNFDPTIGGDMLVPWLQRAAQQKLAVPSQGQAGRALDVVAKTLRKRAGLQIMVANIVNVLQQATGFSMAAVKVKPRHLTEGLFNYISHPQQSAIDISEKSEFMKFRLNDQMRNVNRDISEIALNTTKYDDFKNFTEKHGYFFQSSFQNVVDNVVWQGAYNQAIELGAKEHEAVREGDSAVRQTQDAMTPESVARVETGTPFTRLFTQFYSYFNMHANLLGGEFSKTMREMGLRKGAGRLMYVYMLGFMIPSVLAEVIVRASSGKGLDEDNDGHYLDDLLMIFFGSQFRTATAMFPAIGPTLNSAVNRFNKKPYDDRISTSPAISAVEQTVSAPHSVYKTITEGTGKKNAIRDTLTAMSMLTGVPVAPLARPLGYLSDVSEGKAQPTGPIDLARGLITGKSGQNP